MTSRNDIPAAELRVRIAAHELTAMRVTCQDILERLNAICREQAGLNMGLSLDEPTATEVKLDLNGQKLLLFRRLHTDLGEHVTKKSLKNVLFSFPRPANSLKDYVDDEDGLLGVQISNLRKSLKHSSYEILTVYGDGYRMVYRNG
jgi:DNA-binding response OmpR family regulator